jgi:uncharacterized protein
MAGPRQRPTSGRVLGGPIRDLRLWFVGDREAHRGDMGATPSLSPPADRPAGRRPDVLRPSECWTLLVSQSVGRVGFVVDGWPLVLPVNYVVDAEDVLIRTGAGAKLASMQTGAQVTLEVDSTESLYRSGWSVLVFGVGAVVTDPDELEHARSLPLKPWVSGELPYWVKIRPVQVTGRRLPRAWRYPGPLP